MIIIHYNNSTGEIKSWGSSSSPPENGSVSHLNECSVLILEYEPNTLNEIAPETHKIDLNDRILIHKTKGEIAQSLLPTLFDVKAAILEELILTDNYINPPNDRPKSGPFKFDWKDYRETLRDLSKLKTTPQAMVDAWPMRPNGEDAIPRLREQVSESKLLKSLDESF